MFFGILTALSLQSVYAETELEKATVAQYQQYFNNKDHAETYQTFSEEMQKALPLSTYTQVSESLYQQLGQLKNVEFIEYKNKMAVYKATFEQGVLTLSIHVNDEKQIAGLLFTPFIEKKENLNVVNAIKAYPKEVADKIFTATKNFPEGTQVAIAVYEQGKTKYYGVEQHQDKIQNSKNQQQVFAIGSVSKVLTSTVLAELVTQNKLKLDDTINSYYPFPFKDNIQLRFQDLSNHTSGLARLPSNMDLSSLDNPYKTYDANKLESYLKDELELVTTDNQGKTPQYSNLGVGLLGHTMGLSQQKSFEQLLKIYVFDKYGMKNSSVSLDKAGKKLVPALDTQGGEIPTWEFDTMLAAGGILSSVEDLMKFAKSQLDDKNAVAKLMQKPTTEKVANHQVGLGWFIDAKDQQLIWHGGNTAGHTSILVLDLKNKKAAAILSNVANLHADMPEIEKLALQLLK